MRPYPLHTWQEAPFLRLIIPFMAGIAMEWYGSLWPLVWWVLLMFCVAGMIVFNRRLSFRQFQHGWLNGAFIQLAMIALGALVCWFRDPAQQPNRFTRYYHPAANQCAQRYHRQLYKSAVQPS